MSRLRLEGGPRVGRWNPLDLGRGTMAAWWAAPDLADGLTSSFKDRVNQIDLTASGSARPTASGGWLNADGVANVLSLTGVPSALPTGSAPGVLFSVHRHAGDGSGNNNLFGYGVAATGRAFRTTSSGTGLRVTGDGVTIGDDVIAETGAHIGLAIFTGTELLGRIDGRPFVGSFPSLALVPNTAITRVRMFGSLGTTASNLWPGAVRHAGVLGRIPSDAILQKIEGYLAWESGLQGNLPDGHPYKRGRP